MNWLESLQISSCIWAAGAATVRAAVWTFLGCRCYGSFFCRRSQCGWDTLNIDHTLYQETEELGNGLIAEVWSLVAVSGTMLSHNAPGVFLSFLAGLVTPARCLEPASRTARKWAVWLSGSAVHFGSSAHETPKTIATYSVGMPPFLSIRIAQSF